MKLMVAKTEVNKEAETKLKSMEVLLERAEEEKPQANHLFFWIFIGLFFTVATLIIIFILALKFNLYNPCLDFVTDRC